MKEIVYAHIEERVTTRVARIFFRSDGITEVHIDKKAEVDLDASREMFEVLRKRSKTENRKMLVLVTGGMEATITREARAFAGTDEASSITIAEAVIVRTLAHRLVINFLLNFYKPKRYLRMFTNEKEAIKWLCLFKDRT